MGKWRLKSKNQVKQTGEKTKTPNVAHLGSWFFLNRVSRSTKSVVLTKLLNSNLDISKNRKIKEPKPDLTIVISKTKNNKRKDNQIKKMYQCARSPV